MSAPPDPEPNDAGLGPPDKAADKSPGNAPPDPPPAPGALFTEAIARLAAMGQDNPALLQEPLPLVLRAIALGACAEMTRGANANLRREAAGLLLRHTALTPFRGFRKRRPPGQMDVPAVHTAAVCEGELPLLESFALIDRKGPPANPRLLNEVCEFLKALGAAHAEVLAEWERFNAKRWHEDGKGGARYLSDKGERDVPRLSEAFGIVLKGYTGIGDPVRSFPAGADLELTAAAGLLACIAGEPQEAPSERRRIKAIRDVLTRTRFLLKIHDKTYPPTGEKLYDFIYDASVPADEDRIIDYCEWPLEKIVAEGGAYYPGVPVPPDNTANIHEWLKKTDYRGPAWGSALSPRARRTTLAIHEMYRRHAKEGVLPTPVSELL